MKKVTVFLVILCLIVSMLFVPTVSADRLLISQDDTGNLKYIVGYGECLAQKFVAVESQVDVTKVSLYIVDEWGTGGTCKAGISAVRTTDESQWLSSDSRSLSGMNGWEEFSDVDCSVTPGNTYYIMYKVITSGGIAAVHGSTNNPYSNGEVHWYVEGSWETYSSCDLGFEIYGNLEEPNEEPNSPGNPSPSNGATGVSVNTDLSWSCSDPDGDPLTYDVYFGTNSNPPKVKSGHTSKTYDPGTLSYSTKYYWKIKAWDDHDHHKEGPVWSFGSQPNAPPDIPSKPSGTGSGRVNTPYTYQTSTDDPNDDDVYYLFDWDDGTNSGWVGPYSSGGSGSATHTWTSTDTYHVKVKAKDEHGAESGWSDPLLVTITNEAPDTPRIPTGSASGYHGESYTYSTSASDPEGQKVKYEFDWGDGTSDWTGWVGSGKSASKEHTWSNPGTYCVKAKARDESGDDSDYSECYHVTMGNRAPDVPYNPSPEPGDDWVDVECDLSWSCGDPDGDSLKFDVYFGTNSSPPRVLKNHQSFSYSPPGMLDILTTYYWRVVAFDCCDGCDAETSSLVWSFTTRGGYHSPVLSLYDGWLKGNSPDWGTYSDEFVFKVHYYDEDGDPASVASLVVDDVLEFSMNKIGGGSAADADYEARLMSSEFGGGYHEYYFWFEDGTISDDVRFPDVGGWHFTVNYPPDKPALAGPSSGNKNVELFFDAVASDKDGDKIQYWFDWGDGTNTGWTPLEPVSSGTKVTRSHSWSSRGSYTVKVKARDINEDESDWDSITLSISTPKSIDKLRVSSFFEKLLDKFPLLKLLLSSQPFFNELMSLKRIS